MIEKIFILFIALCCFYGLIIFLYIEGKRTYPDYTWKEAIKAYCKRNSTVFNAPTLNILLIDNKYLFDNDIELRTK